MNLKLKKCAIFNRRMSVMSLLTDRNALSQIEGYFLKLLTFKLKKSLFSFVLKKEKVCSSTNSLNIYDVCIFNIFCYFQDLLDKAYVCDMQL